MGIHSEVGTGSPVEQSTFLWEVMNKRMEHLGVLGLVPSAHRGSEYPLVRMGYRGLGIKKGSSHFLPQPETSHNPQAALSRLCRHVVENGEFSKFCENVVQPRNHSWITKVHASSWRTSHNKKISHHPEGAHEFFDFTLHTNTLRVFFAPNCRF